MTNTEAAAVPVGRIEWITDRYSVGLPDDELAAEITRRCTGAEWTPATIAAAVGVALARHHDNRRLYATVTRGSAA